MLHLCWADRAHQLPGVGRDARDGSPVWGSHLLASGKKVESDPAFRQHHLGPVVVVSALGCGQTAKRELKAAGVARPLAICASAGSWFLAPQNQKVPSQERSVLAASCLPRAAISSCLMHAA